MLKGEKSPVFIVGSENMPTFAHAIDTGKSYTASSL